MRRKQIFFASLALFVSLFYCDKLRSQDCKNYYYMTNNAEIQMTLYDGNGAKSGLQNWKISEVSKESSGFRSTINSVFTNAKGEEIAKGKGVYRCNGGKLMADMRMSVPQDQQKDVAAGSATVNDAFIEYPEVLSEGMSLPDAFIDMDVSTSGIPSTARFEMKNRKVVAKEKITSEAGAWEAYRITYDATIKIKMAGIGIPMVMRTTEWFVPFFGVVKTETFSRKGKKTGSSLLTAMKK